jgi:hypothetical protein
MTTITINELEVPATQTEVLQAEAIEALAGTEVTTDNDVAIAAIEASARVEVAAIDAEARIADATIHAEARTETEDQSWHINLLQAELAEVKAKLELLTPVAILEPTLISSEESSETVIVEGAESLTPLFTSEEISETPTEAIEKSAEEKQAQEARPEHSARRPLIKLV